MSRSIVWRAAPASRLSIWIHTKRPSSPSVNMLTHHAYYIEGSLSLFEAYVNGIRASENYDTHDSDFHFESFEKIGIDDSQKLAQQAALKNVSGRALYIIGIASMTSEAQQALLKLFEEPQRGSVFIVLVPYGMLLPTLRSRMMEY